MEEHEIECPYCGESISILVDDSAGNQNYYEDCSVCCCPILIEISIDALGDTKLMVKRDDE